MTTEMRLRNRARADHIEALLCEYQHRQHPAFLGNDPVDERNDPVDERNDPVDECTVSDFLADLLHYCDAWNLDFDAECDRARSHHDAEEGAGDDLDQDGEDSPVEEQVNDRLAAFVDVIKGAAKPESYTHWLGRNPRGGGAAAYARWLASKPKAGKRPRVRGDHARSGELEHNDHADSSDGDGG